MCVRHNTFIEVCKFGPKFGPIPTNDKTPGELWGTATNLTAVVSAARAARAAQRGGGRDETDW